MERQEGYVMEGKMSDELTEEELAVNFDRFVSHPGRYKSTIPTIHHGEAR
jgi:hypothetical protein